MALNGCHAVLSEVDIPALSLEFRATTETLILWNIRYLSTLGHAILETSFTIPNAGSLHLYRWLSVAIGSSGHDAPSGCVPEIVVLNAGSAYTYPDQMMSKLQQNRTEQNK